MKPTKKKKIDYSRAWAEARKLIWHNRWRLALGLVLMLASRAAGMVLPYSTKFLVDNVFGQKQYEMLWVIALVVGLAAVFQSATSFALSQVLGVAAHRAITEMRKRVQAHIERLPTSYFDSTQTGQLISRIMRDAEGIRNLVGTGLGQIIGGLLSAMVSMAVLFYLNWQITLITLAVLGVFGYVLSYAFKKAGFNRQRSCGEMTWALKGIPGSDHFLEYEAFLNTIVANFPHSGMCQYDARLFDGATLFKVLKIHPWMVVQGKIVQNPYFMSSDEFLEEFRSGQ